VDRITGRRFLHLHRHHQSIATHAFHGFACRLISAKVLRPSIVPRPVLGTRLHSLSSSSRHAYFLFAQGCPRRSRARKTSERKGTLWRRSGGDRESRAGRECEARDRIVDVARYVICKRTPCDARLSKRSSHPVAPRRALSQANCFSAAFHVEDRRRLRARSTQSPMLHAVGNYLRTVQPCSNRWS